MQSHDDIFNLYCGPRYSFTTITASEFLQSRGMRNNNSDTLSIHSAIAVFTVNVKFRTRFNYLSGL